MNSYYFKYFKLAIDDYGALKEDIKKRDNYKCRKCGSTYGLLVHHIREAKKRPDLFFDKDNLITLCSACHGKIHGQRRKRRNRVVKREKGHATSEFAIT